MKDAPLDAYRALPPTDGLVIAVLVNSPKRLKEMLEAEVAAALICAESASAAHARDGKTKKNAHRRKRRLQVIKAAPNASYEKINKRFGKALLKSLSPRHIDRLKAELEKEQLSTRTL